MIFDGKCVDGSWQVEKNTALMMAEKMIHKDVRRATLYIFQGATHSQSIWSRNRKLNRAAAR